MQKTAKSIAQAVLAENTDVIFFTEILNRESLLELARMTGHQFESVFIEGNDVSKNDIGMLIRKTLPLDVVVQSHRATQHEFGGALVPLHSRDLLMVTLTIPGDERPLLVIFNSHLKSEKKPKDGEIDTSGLKRSAQESDTVLKAQEAATTMQPMGTMIVADFNVDVRRSDQLGRIKNAGFVEALDALNIPMHERSTHDTFTKSGQRITTQKDAAFVSREIIESGALQTGYVVANQNKKGEVIRRPKSFGQRNQLISDHQMYVVELSVPRLRQYGNKSPK